MKKSVCIETIFTEVPFEERFHLARKAGFDYIEFWSWKDKDIKKIKQLCEANDLIVASFSGDQSYSLVDENHKQPYIEFIKESIETAKYLNCDSLVIHSNALGEMGRVVNHYNELSKYKKFGTMLNVLTALAPIAEMEKVTLVLEALNTEVDHAGNFLTSTKDCAEAIRLVNSPYIKVLYDVYHMQIMEGNIVDTLKKYIDIIGYIHIADVPGRHEPGTGEINYVNVINTLRTLRYDKVVGFELFPLYNSNDAVESIHKL